MCALLGHFHPKNLKISLNYTTTHKNGNAETPPVPAKSLSDEIICFAKRSFCLLVFYDEQFCSPSLSFFYDDDELSFTFEHFFSPTRTTPPRNKDDDDKTKMETIIIDYY